MTLCQSHTSITVILMPKVCCQEESKTDVEKNTYSFVLPIYIQSQHNKNNNNSKNLNFNSNTDK